MDWLAKTLLTLFRVLTSLKNSKKKALVNCTYENFDLESIDVIKTILKTAKSEVDSMLLFLTKKQLLPISIISLKMLK